MTDDKVNDFLDWFGAFASEKRVRLIATMRSDFVGKMMAHPAISRIFGDSFDEVLFPLLPPSERNLYEMIERPAQAAGIEFEKGLVDKIVEDTGTGDTRLPLMAYVLEQLYMRGSKFTIAGYLESGGIDGAIEQKVAEALQNIHREFSSASEDDVCKAIISVFAKLLDVDEDTGTATRRRCRMTELPDTAISQCIINEFINSHLLSANDRNAIQQDGNDHEPTLEVAHEAIFRKWGMLREWIDLQKDAFIAKKALARDTKVWDIHARPNYMRWSDERCLEIATQIRQIGYFPTTLEKEFLGTVDPEEMQRLIRETDTPHDVRQTIGVRLALLGDPRPGTGTITGLPDIVWCSIAGAVVLLDGIDRTFTVPSFDIAKYPITQTQFRVFVDDDGYCLGKWWDGLAERKFKVPGRQYPAYANYPAVNVDWMEAIAYCRWLSAKLGDEVRLPTEAEWQLAASYDRQGFRYPWGDQFDSTRANTYESDLNQTIAVGLYAQEFADDAPLDLCGNVWEWCLDEFEAPSDIGNIRYATIVDRVRRGGSWDDEVHLAATATRFYRHPHQRYSDIGFRVLRPRASKEQAR